MESVTLLVIIIISFVAILYRPFSNYYFYRRFNRYRKYNHSLLVKNKELFVFNNCKLIVKKTFNGDGRKYQFEIVNGNRQVITGEINISNQTAACKPRSQLLQYHKFVQDCDY